jgi:hypothetical protein
MLKPHKPAKAVIPTLRFSTLEIDHKEYRLAYSYNAIALAEEASGCNLLVGLENLRDLTALQLRGLFYASLTPFQPSITVDQAGDLIGIASIGPITAAIADAYRKSMERPAEKSQDPPPAVPEAAPEVAAYPEPAHDPETL